MSHDTRPAWTDMNDGTHAASWSADDRWYIEHDRPMTDEPWVVYFCEDTIGDILTDVETYATLDLAKQSIESGHIYPTLLQRLEELVVGAARRAVVASLAARKASDAHETARGALTSAVAGLALAAN